MNRFSPTGRLGWLALGAAAGLLAAGFWPQSPLHAVATDRSETFAIATGQIDEGMEAIYFLDFVSGDLRAAVVSRQSGKFNAFFEANVLHTLGVDPSRNPRYMMVTGLADIRRGGPRMQVGRSIVYVAEVTSGRVAAYAIPWGPTTVAAGQVIQQPLMLMDVTTFRAGP
jgi:hypothetical protein